MEISSVLITPDMINNDGSIKKEVYNPLNLDKEVREYRQQEKEGKPLWWS
jgi:hypothetical protein